MKYLLYILFFFASIAMHAQKNCIELAKQQSSVQCLQKIEPVCGCNGITYPNSCVAEKNGVQSYTQGKCPKNDSIIQANSAFLSADCLSGTHEDSLALHFSSDSLLISGHLKLAFCGKPSIFYSISEHEIIFFQDSINGKCSDSCTRQLQFSLPIKKQNWYHIVFANYIDTLLYFTQPNIQKDTIDFTFGSCIDTAKQKRMALTYQNESLILHGITQASCCSSGKTAYSVFRSTISLLTTDSIKNCNCQCMYLFNCKIPNILPGLYRIKGYGFDTLITIAASTSNIENFVLSTDTLLVKKDQNSYFTIKTTNISGFKLQNDNTTCVEAKLFGNDVVLRGLKAGKATIRISNLVGYEQSCLVLVEDIQQSILLPDTASASNLNTSYQLRYQSNPQNAPILWQSSNKNVAIINASGIITILSNGTTKIIANILNTNISDTCILTVKTSQAQLFAINSQLIKNISELDTIMTLGESRQISLQWFDKQQMQSVKWLSHNNEIIKINEAGVLQAIGIGKTSIVAGTELQENIDSITLHVVSEAYMYKTMYYNHTNRIQLRFSKDIKYMADTLSFWSIYTSNNEKQYLPISISQNYNELEIEIDTSFRNSDYVNLQLKSSKAIVFNDNSLLLPKTIQCYSQSMATNVNNVTSDNAAWYYNKTLYINKLCPSWDIKVYSSSGQIVNYKTCNSNQIPIELPLGYYHAQIINDKETIHINFVVTE